MKPLLIALLVTVPTSATPARASPPSISPAQACDALPNPDAISRAYCERRERVSADAIPYVWAALSPASARLCAGYPSNQMILECAYRRAVADDQDRTAGGR